MVCCVPGVDGLDGMVGEFRIRTLKHKRDTDMCSRMVDMCTRRSSFGQRRFSVLDRS